MALSVSGDDSLEWHATLNIEDFQGKLNELEANLKSNFDKEVQRDLLRQKAQTEYVQAITSSAEAFSLLDDRVKIQIADLIDLRAELSKIKEAQATVGQGASSGEIDSSQATALLAGLFVKEKQLEAAINQTTGAINKQINAGQEGFDEFGNKVKDTGDKVQRVSARIREITNELVGLQEGTPRFNALITEAAELTDQLGDARAQIQLLASDTSHLDAGVQAIQGLVGVFSAAQGAMALFGDENKDLEKALLKVNAAMALLQGLQQIGQILDTKSALNIFLLKTLRQEDAAATALEAEATTALAAAEGEAVVATEALTVAMEANPAGVLLLAVTALFAAYQALASATQDAEEEQQKMNKAIADAGNILVELANIEKQVYEEQTRNAKDALSYAQSQGKSQKEISELQLKVTEAKKLENVYTLSRLNYDKQSLALAQQQIASYDDQIHGLKSIVALGGQLSDFDEKRLASFENQKKAIESTFLPAKEAYNNILATDAEAANIRAEQAKKAHDDSLKSSQAEADARLILAKKNSREELNARIADIRTAARAELDNVNLTSGERKKIIAQEQKDIADATRAFNILQLNNQKSLLNAQLADVEVGSAKELGLKIDLLNKTAQIERAADGVTAERKKEIAAKLAKDVSDLTSKHAFDNQKQEVDIVIATTGAKLSAAKKGSEQELQLNKQLIDAKATADIISAQQQIKNQELLVAKIKEINAKARQDEKRLDDEYFNNRLQEQIKQIDNATALQNIPLQAAQNDPFATYKQKYDAQKELIANDIRAVDRQMDLVRNNIIKGQGDEKILEEQYNTLWLKSKQLRSDLSALNNSHSEDSLKAFAKYAAAASSAFHAIGEAVAGFNEGLADTLNTMGDLAGKAASVASAIASHDPAAIVSAGIDAVGAVIKLFTGADESRKKAQAELEAYQVRVIEGEVHVNEQYRERLRTQVTLNKLRIEGIKAESDLLKQQQAQNLSDFDRILGLIRGESSVTGEHTETSGGFLGIGRKTKVVQDLSSLAGSSYDDLERLFNSGALTEKAKALFQELQKLKQEGVDIDAQLEENKKKAEETFTGTTADSITDMIVQGFANGKRAVADFADDTESLIRGALLNALKYRALEGPLQKLYDQFAADAESNGGLDLSEVAKFQNGIAEVLKNANTMAEELQKATGVSLSTPNGSGQGNSLSGAIKGMTAQQADLLAGQFGGLRLTALDQLRVISSSLSVLNKIEANTAAASATLASYYRKWDSDGIKVR